MICWYPVLICSHLVHTDLNWRLFLLSYTSLVKFLQIERNELISNMIHKYTRRFKILDTHYTYTYRKCLSHVCGVHVMENISIFTNINYLDFCTFLRRVYTKLKSIHHSIFKQNIYIACFNKNQTNTVQINKTFTIATPPN